MSWRNGVAWGFIGALVVANVVYWGAQAKPHHHAGAEPGIATADFHIAAWAKAPLIGRMRRDPFAQPRSAPSSIPVGRSTPVVLPPPTPRQIAAQSGQAELSRLKCIGVVYRKSQRHAFLLLGRRAFVVRVGTVVDHRFLVQSISLDGVSLQDRESDVTGQLPVAGN